MRKKPKKKRSAGHRAKSSPKPSPQDTPIQTASPDHSSKSSTMRKGVVAAIGIVSGMIGIWLGLLTLPPRVEVNAPNNFFEPSDPFSGEFSIGNEGTFSIYRVQIACIFKRDIYRGHHIDVHDNITTFPLADEIRAGKHYKFRCPQAVHFSFDPQSSALIVQASFRPSILFWQHFESARFLATANKEGKWYWFSN